MKLILSLLPFSLLLNGCGNSSWQEEQKAAPDSASVTATVLPDTLCFQQVTGRDTTRLRLRISGTTVTGELAMLPYEKDRAAGPLSGTLENQVIRAEWQRSGEGVTQPYVMVFTLKGDAVTWREGERMEKDGKWVLKQPEQGYENRLTKADCR
ncbi:hypothetical protein [Larkinella soli]|uniref:hypothetical protein n=1 Tax=Larkinella soli TaxID=1770527 RepID=UPI000FFCC2D5|nr:hypothetical protein [Larkinella soli]